MLVHMIHVLILYGHNGHYSYSRADFHIFFKGDVEKVLVGCKCGTTEQASTGVKR